MNTRTNQEIIKELKAAIASDKALLAALRLIGKGNSDNATWAKNRIAQAKAMVARIEGK